MNKVTKLCCVNDNLKNTPNQKTTKFLLRFHMVDNINESKERMKQKKTFKEGITTREKT